MPPGARWNHQSNAGFHRDCMRKEWRAKTAWDYHNNVAEPGFAFLAVPFLQSEVDQLRRLHSKPRRTDPVGHGLNDFDHRTQTSMKASMRSKASMRPQTASVAERNSFQHQTVQTQTAFQHHLSGSIRSWKELKAAMPDEQAFLSHYVLRKHSHRYRPPKYGYAAS